MCQVWIQNYFFNLFPSTATPKGMPAEFEKYHESDDHVIINVPPNFMFKAKIFKPSRLCAIYRKVREILKTDDYWNWHSLASLEYIPYIDASGQLSEQFQSKVGVYAILIREKRICGLFPRCWSQPQAAPRAPTSKATGSKCKLSTALVVPFWEHPGCLDWERVDTSYGSEEAKWTQPIDAK